MNSKKTTKVFLYFAGLTAILTAFLVFSLGCGLQNEIKNDEFKYSFSENSCQTGEKSFSTLSAMCAGLQNNSINNGCALIERQNYFYSKCSGGFVAN